MTVKQNAKAFVGGSFTPAGASSATLKARISPEIEMPSVLTVRQSSTTVWSGFPIAPTIGTATNTVTGSFPNRSNNISVSWTHPGSPVLEGFHVYYNTGGGWIIANTSIISAASRSFSIGSIPAGVTYTFQIYAVSKSDIVQVSPTTTNITLSAPSAPTPTSASTSSTSITWSWTVSSGAYQEFEIQTSSNNVTWSSAVSVAGHATNTSFSYELTGLTQNVTRYLRVRGRNNNNHWSSYSTSVAGVSANAAPPAPTATLTSSAANISNLKTFEYEVLRTMTWTANNAADSEFSKMEVYIRQLPNAFPVDPNFTYNTTGSRTGTFVGAPNVQYEIKVVQYDTYNATSETTVLTTAAAVATTTVLVQYTATYTNWKPSTYAASNTSGTASTASAVDNNDTTLWFTTQFSSTNPSPAPWFSGLLDAGGSPSNGGSTLGGRITGIRFRGRVTHSLSILINADSEWKTPNPALPTYISLVGGEFREVWTETTIIGESSSTIPLDVTWSGGNANIYIAYRSVGTWTTGGTTFTRRASLMELGFDWERYYTVGETRYY